MLLTGVANAMFSPLTGIAWKETIIGCIKVVLLLITGVITIRFVGHLSHLFFGPLLKVMLDIFRYVGEPDYRDHLQHELDSQLASTRDTAITICAHSLGSVIALDSLLNSAYWSQTHSVTLVTMGSPLRRCFFRFFPNLLFPPSSSQAHCQIMTRIGTFQWVNVYRPLDPIGTSLRFSSDGAGQDVSTGQWSRFNAHPGYFVDPIVYRTINSALSRSIHSRRMLVTSGSRSWQLPNFTPLPRMTRSILKLMPKLTWLLPLLVLGMLWESSRDKAKWDAGIAASREKLSREGHWLSARVEEWQTVEGSGKYTNVINHLRFAFESNSLNLHDYSIKTGGLFDRTDSFFDTNAIWRKVQQDCEPQRTRALFQKKSLVPCLSRRPFHVRWLNASPPIFDVPDYPPANKQWMTFWQWMFQIVCLVGLSLFAGYFVIQLGQHLLSVLAGAN